MSENSPPAREPPFPVAKVVDSSPRTARWIMIALLLGSVSILGSLILANLGRREMITIRFRQGHGLSPGDPIRHRGIQVGRTVKVELDPTLSSVVVTCELFAGAERLACEGTQFWIVRPSISLQRVEGLDTLVEGRYLSVLPGPATAQRTTEFVGLRDSPGSAEELEGGLEIALEAAERFGLARGTPIYFRGMRVGQVVSVALSSDSLTVEARAVVGPDYQSLVRENSVFWKDSGVNFQLGFRGLNLDVGTLESLAAGGVAFATPDPPGSPVASGHRYIMQAKEIDDWRDWKPRLVVGSTSLPDGAVPPTMIHAEMITTRKRLVGGLREVRTGGWLLPIAGGRVVMPAGFVDATTDEGGPPARLAFAGSELRVRDQVFRRFGDLIVFQPSESPSDRVDWLPLQRMRVATVPEDCLLFTDPDQPPVPLSRRRFSTGDSAWSIDTEAELATDSWGGAVVSREDGSVVGILDFRDNTPLVVPIPSKLVNMGGLSQNTRITPHSAGRR